MEIDGPIRLLDEEISRISECCKNFFRAKFDIEKKSSFYRNSLFPFVRISNFFLLNTWGKLHALMRCIADCPSLSVGIVFVLSGHFGHSSSEFYDRSTIDVTIIIATFSGVCLNNRQKLDLANMGPRHATE